MARPAGLSKATIEKIRRGEKVSPVTMKKYKELYGEEGEVKNTTANITEDDIEMKVVAKENAADAFYIPDKGLTQRYDDDTYMRLYRNGLLGVDEDEYLSSLVGSLKQEQNSNEENEVEEPPFDIDETQDSEDSADVFESIINGDLPFADNDNSIDEVWGENKEQKESPQENEEIPDNTDDTDDKVDDESNEVLENVKVDIVEEEKLKIVEEKEEKIDPSKIVFKIVDKYNEEKPQYGSPEWTDYILSQLTSIEKVVKDGKPFPRNAGLKRLLEKEIGQIINTSVVVDSIPTKENRYLAVVRCRVDVKVNKDRKAVGFIDNYSKDDYETISWEDIAENFVGDSQASDVVMSHPISSTATAAYTRCYRNLLGLVGVYGIDEMGSAKPDKGSVDLDAPSIAPKSITDTQINFIKRQCEIYEVDYVKASCNILGRKIDDIDLLSFDDGRSIQSIVNSFSSNSEVLSYYKKNFSI